MNRLLLAVLLATCLLPGLARAEDWEARMLRQISKKVSIELVDTPLSEACALLTSITGLNIIIAPAVRQNDPKINLKVTDMEAGTALKWLTQLTETHAELVDQAIFITDKPSKKKAEAEREGMLILAAAHGILAPDMPPEGADITNEDRVKFAMTIIEKEQIKIQDFPGPTVGFDKQDLANPFGFGAPGK
jgi:hypothetical protein